MRLYAKASKITKESSNPNIFDDIKSEMNMSKSKLGRAFFFLKQSCCSFRDLIKITTYNIKK